MGLLINLLFLVVLVVVVYLLYTYFTSKKAQLSSLQSGKKHITVAANKLPTNKASNNYAYSVWFYVNNWQYKLGEPKDLLTRGGSGLGATTNPLITLAPYENNIQINISTYPTKTPSTTHTPAPEQTPGCTITNFPLQKWVNLIISLNGRTLDVYIDGKLVRTCVLPSVAKVDASAPINITDNGGFDGWTSNLQYFATPLNPEQAYNIYKNGPGSGGILRLFEKYKIKVAYLVDNKEQGSIEI